MMKRRYLLLVVAILLLGLLNLWLWKSPTGSVHERAAVPAGVFRPDDFQLKVGFATAESVRSARNIFQPRVPPRPPTAKQVEKKVEAPMGPPPKTPEQLAEEASRAELGQFKLVGVVFRGEKGEAFLVKGDQAYMVHKGGKVGERFQVEAIRADGVDLRDPATQVNGRIPVSGN